MTAICSLAGIWLLRCYTVHSWKLHPTNGAMGLWKKIERQTNWTYSSVIKWVATELCKEEVWQQLAFLWSMLRQGCYFCCNEAVQYRTDGLSWWCHIILIQVTWKTSTKQGEICEANKRCPVQRNFVGADKSDKVPFWESCWSPSMVLQPLRPNWRRGECSNGPRVSWPGR